MYAKQKISHTLLSPFKLKGERYYLQHGVSLIELIMFIVIISIAVSGVLLVMNNVNRHSADAVHHKQAIASAESLLEEIELQDFNPVAANAPVTLANRTSVYHIVNDYNGFASAGIFSASTGALVPGLGLYNVNVTVTPTALGGIAAANSVLITVNVTSPLSTTPIRISGYRTNHP
jgi:MSHA pilin protein MshD